MPAGKTWAQITPTDPNGRASYAAWEARLRPLCERCCQIAVAAGPGSIPAAPPPLGSPAHQCDGWDVDIGAWDRIGTPDGPGMADLAGIAGVIRIGSDGAR